MSSTEASLAPFLMEVGRKTHLGFISLNLLLQSAFKKQNNKKTRRMYSHTSPARRSVCIALINFLSKDIILETAPPPAPPPFAFKLT